MKSCISNNTVHTSKSFYAPKMIGTIMQCHPIQGNDVKYYLEDIPISQNWT